MSPTLLILKNYTTFKDFQMVLKHFFDISTGFRYKKNGKEFSVHLKRRPWLIYSVITIYFGLRPKIKNTVFLCIFRGFVDKTLIVALKMDLSKKLSKALTFTLCWYIGRKKSGMYFGCIFRGFVDKTFIVALKNKLLKFLYTYLN